ncbi:thiol-disulfide oxidoreductase DCC family protein [Pseudoduganella umbonata]|uniref:Putative DCC family thiol-disulfide oxidoreductase YuxK n=1 Tax=Pseudoduganella umbonata TaxID=864828 RepID=A0A4P8HRR0_9BURK|nr:thiol-disulfide oxidoreductase DCC family protein [Pseudoduganella umbonata]MBB3222290.1 putative DCC family thiol-disulfide oxidoreductase YuxK [Pseudoduganella umbonata]QCP12513.1 thiol-disulfide oxidoreductase DCC family protein [Pseudoduganella umbonata]
MLIIFDGHCNFCNGWVRFVAKRDKAGLFNFATTHSITGSPIVRAAGMDPDDVESIILVDGDRRLLNSDAVLAIVSRLGGMWAMASVLRIVPRKVRDFCYRQFARRRYALFGKRDHCTLPPEELGQQLRERFLP